MASWTCGHLQADPPSPRAHLSIPRTPTHLGRSPLAPGTAMPQGHCAHPDAEKTA